MIKFRIRTQFLTLLILTGLIPLMIVGGLFYFQASNSMLDSSKNSISSIQEIRKRQLEETTSRQISGFLTLLEAIDFNSILQDKNSSKDFIGLSLQNNGYYNLYVLSPDQGIVLYDYLGEQGYIGNSGLVRVWEKAVVSTGTVIQDFSSFAPSKGIQSGFIAKKHNFRGQDLIVVLQFTSDFIGQTLKSTEGMGTTGESYIISYDSDSNEFEFRSNIITLGNGEYKIGATLKNPLEYWKDAVDKGSDGGEGIYRDSLGKKVLVKFDKLDISGLNWFLISKISKNEVLEDLWPIVISIFIVTFLLFLIIVFVSLLFSGKLTEPITMGADFATSIANGEFNKSLDINRKDELGKLAKALKDMGKSLKEQEWLRMGKEGLDDTLRGEHDVKKVGYKFISFMVKHLNAQVGVLYLLEEDNFLHLSSSYAFTDRQGNYNKIAIGEGLVGQAAKELEEIVYTHVPTDSPTFNYGVGDILPTAYIASPLVFEENLIGVYLIGLTVPVTSLQKKFISLVRDNIAITINSAKANTIIQSLFEEAQKQQEELRVSNEELEQQTLALRESEQTLQAQQEELRVTNEELEERTEALEAQRRDMKNKNAILEGIQLDLEEKARALEMASKYKSEFLANMSHELRTPLNSILILSQLIAKNTQRNLDEKQIKSAQAIYSSGADLLKLINEILDLSKVEAGKIEVNPEVMTIDSLVDTMERVFRPSADNDGKGFGITVSRDLPPSIVTDCHRLEQILKNLLTNAFKFTQEKGKVSLDIYRKENNIFFSVKDTGIGIPKDKIDSIFEAFQQADGSTSRKYGGTGLGLSISRELAKLLGGGITLESVVGEGSNFSLFIPIVEGVTRTPSKQITSKIEKKEVHVKDDREDVVSQGKTLLIIEDDVTFSTVLKEQAHDRGFKVLIAEDGETGLHFADYYKPSAIILDIGLPGIDGWAVMERLKENPELRHIPVHFMSGKDNKLPAMKMGAVGYMMKPVTLDGLKNAFERIENIISSRVNNLLIVEDDKIQRDSIEAYIDGKDVNITGVATGKDAYENLKKGNFDCIILDLGLEDMSGYELLDKIKSDEDIRHVPVIVYTGRDLTQDEEQKLSNYAESIIIKGAKSPERLLEETALFMHRVNSDLPSDTNNPAVNLANREHSLAGKTVLLVDDDMRNIFALSNILEEKDINVIIARDGLESIEKIKSTPSIQLVLMDIMMPRMDGYEAMGEIRKMKGKEELPIIALTANAMKGDRNKCIDAGANDYLAKPVDNDKLLSMLRVWMY